MNMTPRWPMETESRMRISETMGANKRRLTGESVRQSYPAFHKRIARGPLCEMVAVELPNGNKRYLYEDGTIDEGSRVNSRVPHYVVGGVLGVEANRVQVLDNFGGVDTHDKSVSPENLVIAA